MRGRLAFQLLVGGLLAALLPAQIALVLVAVANVALAQKGLELALPPAVHILARAAKLYALQFG